MNLIQYIKELLYQQECVTLPGFGSFLSQTHPIKVNRYTGEFTPPSRSISFNRLIQENDGLLASYVAKREGISYPDALSMIENELDRWNKRLDRETMILPGIGEFSFNAENKLRFLPHGKINFDPNALGLASFQRTPEKAQIRAAAIVPPSPSRKPNPSMQDNKEPLAFTPETQEEKKSPTLRYAIIGVVAVALLGASYYFGNQYIESERVKSAELAQKRIAKNVQEATFDLGAITSLELNVPAVIETLEDTNNLIVESGQFYSIIAGSFRDQTNAERKLEELKSHGFEAAFAEASPDGLIRVAYGRFETKREAYRLLNFIKYSLEEEAWYLVEGY